MSIASKLVLTKGVGQNKEKLVSFELALRNAKIAPFNLVKVSSIFPPRCEIVSVKLGLKNLTPGQIVHAVLAEASTNEHHRLVAASVGVAGAWSVWPLGCPSDTSSASNRADSFVTFISTP